jgi:hypothetical protein
MKNKLTDLNDHLFAQLERLSVDDLTPEAIQAEVQRSIAIVQVADTIVTNARLQLDAVKLVASGAVNVRLPATLALPSGAA